MKSSCLIKLATIAITTLISAVSTAAQSSGLPVIRIDTKNGAPIRDRENYVNMTFTLTDPDNPSNNISVINNTDGIRGRGNTTWECWPKKPYRIKFDRKQSLFGLAAAKSWVLLAEYMDPTFMTSMTAFKLGDIFELPYNHTYRHVQLYLNGEYEGVYGLTEQNQAGEGRVNIDEDEGWLVEMSAEYDEEPKFMTTNYDLPVMIKSPETEPVYISNPAYDFVIKDVNELCDSMASETFPENEYRNLIDINAFIDFLMINEIVVSHELGHPKSTYLYRDRGGKISMGPLWDFDWAFSYTGEGFGHTYFSSFDSHSLRHAFFSRFFEDPIFLVKYKERWNEMYDKIAAVSKFIESFGKTIRTAVAEDSKRWNFSGGYFDDYDTDHARQIGYMVNWWLARTEWLNAEMNKVEILPTSRNFGTSAYNYLEISPQTFTLVAYGDITNLSATLQNAESSAFEISAELNKTPTENGGYLAAINVRPKNSLPTSAYTDNLILTGANKSTPFRFEVPLSFVVNKLQITKPTLAELYDFTYDGSEKTVHLTETEGINYCVLSGNRETNAGEYTAIVTLPDSNNYQWIGEEEFRQFELSWAIKQTPLTITAESISTIYGKADPDYTVKYYGFAEGENESVLTGAIEFDCEYEAGKNIGDYDITPKGLTSTNYDITYKTGTLTVNKADPDYDVPTGLTAAYSDLLSSVGLTTGWAWEETGTVGSAGTQKHNATFTPKDTGNYNLATGIEVTVEVAPKGITLVWIGYENLLYDGTASSVTATANGLVGDDECDIIVENGDKTDAGNYTAEATGVSNSNYKLPEEGLTREYTINKARSGVIAGPNPAMKQAGTVKFYREGKRIVDCELRIYDATGNVVNRVKITDKALNSQSRRLVGSWDLTNKNGRSVSGGTYLLKGVVKTLDGTKVKVSAILGVR